MLLISTCLEVLRKTHIYFQMSQKKNNFKLYCEFLYHLHDGEGLPGPQSSKEIKHTLQGEEGKKKQN